MATTRCKTELDRFLDGWTIVGVQIALDGWGDLGIIIRETINFHIPSGIVGQMVDEVCQPWAFRATSTKRTGDTRRDYLLEGCTFTWVKNY